MVYSILIAVLGIGSDRAVNGGSLQSGSLFALYSFTQRLPRTQRYTNIHTFRISGYTADRWYSGQINNIQKLVRRFFLAQPIISLFTFENVEWNNGQVQ